MTKICYVLVAAALLIGTAAGFLLGRALPAHHYVVAGEHGLLLLDTTTGRVCFAVSEHSFIPPCQPAR